MLPAHACAGILLSSTLNGSHQTNRTDLIQRYNASDRANHWFVAITFILLTLSRPRAVSSGIVLFTNLFGGGPWTRILHPFIGIAMFAALCRADGVASGMLNHITAR